MDGKSGFAFKDLSRLPSIFPQHFFAKKKKKKKKKVHSVKVICRWLVALTDFVVSESVSKSGQIAYHFFVCVSIWFFSHVFAQEMEGAPKILPHVSARSKVLM